MHTGCGDEDALADTIQRALVGAVSAEGAMQDAGAPGQGRKAGAESDEPARRRLKHQPLLAGHIQRNHFLQLRLPVRQGLHASVLINIPTYLHCCTGQKGQKGLLF